jgi:hypothetical protein
VPAKEPIRSNSGCVVVAETMHVKCAKRRAPEIDTLILPYLPVFLAPPSPRHVRHFLSLYSSFRFGTSKYTTTVHTSPQSNNIHSNSYQVRSNNSSQQVTTVHNSSQQNTSYEIGAKTNKLVLISTLGLLVACTFQPISRISTIRFPELFVCLLFVNSGSFQVLDTS